MRLLLLFLLFLAASAMFMSVHDIHMKDLVRVVRTALGAPSFHERWTDESVRLLESAPPRIRDLVFKRDSTLVRWAAGAELRIWIDEAPHLAGWRSDLSQRVRRAIAAWEAARLPIRVQYVDDATRANVFVSWTDQLPGETLGTTEVVMNDLFGIQSAQILIALQDADGALVDREKLDATILHEAGHLLGLVHTDDTLSSMHPRSRATTPSAEDIAVLQMLYRLPMGRIPAH